eukprot:TRINITY_DN11097_c0_g1_i1.p2 TRINITY_DN11097_c0_g1~~TRINITY_DN11097_c0_g1_i1.p2  ORF type:complete len:120 (+),score=10.78 TRINITY_DN11097_c0_g1_i1:324-683(+)
MDSGKVLRDQQRLKTEEERISKDEMERAFERLKKKRLIPPSLFLNDDQATSKTLDKAYKDFFRSKKGDSSDYVLSAIDFRTLYRDNSAKVIEEDFGSVQRLLETRKERYQQSTYATHDH